MNTFALIGVAGYIAPKHLKTIKSIGGNLVASADPNDNVEHIDEYFPESEFFKSIEELDKYLKTNPVDFVVVCSPTHLHAQHIEMALNNNCNVICESPLVLNNEQFQHIVALEHKTGKRIYNILQYRYHPDIQKLKKENHQSHNINIDLVYHTFRGKWFDKSWKGDPQKSGGILTSLGYHYFDFLIWIYGNPTEVMLSEISEHVVKGFIQLENASVQFDIRNNISNGVENKKRLLTIDDYTIDLSKPYNNDFIDCYTDIIKENGINTNEVAHLIEVLIKKQSR
ncbi:MAG: Gfo/Idh/MocA family oxidoreductase [Prolixibacteraceae bacterium]|jgi:UDP-N-acetyl-2-amino-2-deoxyglucuronate dehydrogenase|nr:Gfo/Idh/MocA family oxidoreductase [Prolixibacteraceae bacterium]